MLLKLRETKSFLRKSIRLLHEKYLRQNSEDQNCNQNGAQHDQILNARELRKVKQKEKRGKEVKLQGKAISTHNKHQENQMQRIQSITVWSSSSTRPRSQLWI